MKNRIRLKYLLAFLSLLWFSVIATAQTTPSEPGEGTGYESSGHKIAPPSPTAAALGKYGEYTVGGSSGTPGISVPLLEVKGSQMSIPVSLSYAGSGIKVNDIASWVGLGWSLNAGGVVTRTIQGNPDESAGLHHLYNSLGYDPATFSQYNVATGSSGLHTLLAGGFYKGEPDMYSFNFLGYSGQFYIDHENEVHLFEQSDLRIVREFTNGPSGIINWWFTIITGDGTTATFAEAEVTNLDTGDGSSYNAETAWYLATLTSGNDTFHFSYADEFISYGYQFSETEFATSQTSIPCASMGAQDTYGATLGIDKKRLTGIQGPFGTATFIPSENNREDIGGKSLSRISYQDLTVNFNTFFDHGVYSLSMNGESARLFLNSVDIVSENDSKGFVFEYDQTNLPPTNSFAQDYWGYFNGEKLNTTLLPDTDLPFFPGGANREADPEHMDARILTKITYPTGGYTVFEWEPNYKEETTDEEVEVCPAYASFSPDFYHDDPDPFGINEEWSESFSISEVFDIKLKMRVGYIESAGSPENPSAEPGEVDVQIRKGSTLIYSKLFLPSDNSTITLQDQSPGTYTIKMINRSPILDELHLDFDACYMELQPVTSYTYYGGLRAKSIENFGHPDDPSPFTKTDYSYGEVKTSSARSWIDFISTFEVNCADELGPRIYTVQRRSSNNGRNKSNGVSYEWIRESYADGSSKITDFYTTPDNFTGSGATQDKSWMRSKPKIVRLFNQVGERVRQDEYDYTLIRNEEYLGVVISKVIRSLTPFYPEYYAIEHKDVSVQSDWARLDNVTTTEFFPSGELVTTQEFNYFRPNVHVMPGSVTTTFPDGTRKTQVILYPLDIDNALPGGDLRNDYYLKPIESITYDPDEDKILSGQRMAYTSFGQLEFQWNLDSQDGVTYSGFTFSTGHSDPSILGTTYWENPAYEDPEVQIESVGYRTQTLNPRSGVSITYLWGYGQKYPVAEFQNITFDELLALVGQSVLTDIQISTDDSTIKTSLGTIRAQLSSDVLMTSYLYKRGIGVSEIIDANGESTNFNYDGMGRLISVEDDDGNLTTSHEYLYALETK